MVPRYGRRVQHLGREVRYTRSVYTDLHRNKAHARIIMHLQSTQPTSLTASERIRAPKDDYKAHAVAPGTLWAVSILPVWARLHWLARIGEI